MSEDNVENSREKDIFLKIVERFEKFKGKSTRYQIASEEYLASLRENEPQLVTDRLVLTLAGSKGNLVDEYNNKGKNTMCLKNKSKLVCLEILRNEWVEH